MSDSEKTQYELIQEELGARWFFNISAFKRNLQRLGRSKVKNEIGSAFSIGILMTAASIARGDSTKDDLAVIGLNIGFFMPTFSPWIRAESKVEVAERNPDEVREAVRELIFYP